MNINSIPFISLLVLVLMLIIKIRVMKTKGIQTGSGNGEKNKAKRILLPVFFLVFLLWLFELVRPTFQFGFSLLPPFISNPLVDFENLQLTGTVLIIFSLLLFALTLKGFGSSLRFGLDKNNQGPLITKGIFSFSRNPFFLSLNLFFVGVAMILPSIFHLTFTLTALVGIHFFILKEEVFLLKIYGEEYLNYRQKTRRYL